MKLSGNGNGRRGVARTLATVAALAVAVPALAQYGQAPQNPQQAPEKGKKDKPGKAPKSAFSKEFVAAAGTIETNLTTAKAAKAKADAGDAAAKAEYDAAIAAAKAAMPAAEAAIQSPDDRIAAGQLALNLGQFANDIPMRQRGVKYILDSGKLEAAKIPEFQYYLGSFAYVNKDYATASTAMSAALAGGYQGDDAGEILIQSYVAQNQPAQGLAALKQAAAARRAAGKKVPEAWYKRANTAAFNAKLGAEGIDWALAQVEDYPTAFNWLGSTQLVRRFTNYTPNETIDLFRLMMRSGAFDNDPKFTANEFREYIEAADPRRLPGEVIAVVDKGVATKALAGNKWASEMRAMASGRMTADKASLPAAARAAQNARDGSDALAVGDAFLNYGDAAKAEELYKLALQKGVADKERALTRLGIAQFDQGKYADARASFRQVGGARGPIARMWLAFINSKDPAGARAA